MTQKRVLVAVSLNKNSFCLHAQLPPFLHQNKPPRESIFCGKVSDWWTEGALFMLNFLLKIRQMAIGLHTRLWATSRKTRAFTLARASGCRACCSWPLETASWKRRSNRALAAGFQLVGHGLNDCHRVTFSGLTTFYHRQMRAEFHILSYLCSVLRT